MLRRKNKAVKSEEAPKRARKMITMQEAMKYLSDKGVPCKSRTTFYRILEDFNVPYVDINPNGKHAVRRFNKDDLDKVLQATGLQ